MALTGAVGVVPSAGLVAAMSVPPPGLTPITGCGGRSSVTCLRNRVCGWLVIQPPIHISVQDTRVSRCQDVEDVALYDPLHGRMSKAFTCEPRVIS